MKKIIPIAIILAFAILSCKNSDPVVATINPTISASNTSLSFNTLQNNVVVKIATTGNNWTAASNQSWCTLSKYTDTNKSDTVTIYATANTTYTTRNAKVTFTINNNSKDTVSVNVTQAAIPNYSSPIAADATEMPSNAETLVHNMTIGWNLGNTLEVPLTDGGETGWGNPLTTQQLIDGVKAAGFNAIRIPCAWNSYMSDTTTYQLSATWLAHVKQIVDYCYNDNMYVIINIHWDGGWLEDNCTRAKQVAVNLKQRAFWQQIAMNFRDYDEHLLFAGCNEPAVSDTSGMAVLLSYEQTFINAVRSTGGRNSYRTLICEGPSTNIDNTAQYMTTLPTDVATKRLAFEVHDYDPYQFSLMTSDASWGNMFYFWGASYDQQPLVNGVNRNATWGEESWFLSEFAKVKAQFIDNGYPVILGEFGAIRRLSLTGNNETTHLASRAYYLQYVVQQAKTYGLAPFYWDAGSTSDLGSGLFNRSTGAVVDTQGLNALMAGAAQGTYSY